MSAASSSTAIAEPMPWIDSLSLDASDHLTVKHYGIPALSDLQVRIADNSEVQFNVHKAIVAQHCTFFQHLLESDPQLKDIELVNDLPVTVDDIDLLLRTIYGQNGCYMKGSHNSSKASPYFSAGHKVNWNGKNYRVAFPYKAGQPVPLLHEDMAKPIEANFKPYGYGGSEFHGVTAFNDTAPRHSSLFADNLPEHSQHGPPGDHHTTVPNRGSERQVAQGYTFWAHSPTADHLTSTATAEHNTNPAAPAASTAGTARRCFAGPHPSVSSGGMFGNSAPTVHKVDEHQLVQQNNPLVSPLAACEMAERLLPVATYFQATQLLDECYSVVQHYFTLLPPLQKVSWIARFDASHNVTVLNTLLQLVTLTDLQEAATADQNCFEQFRLETVRKLLQRAVNRPFDFGRPTEGTTGEPGFTFGGFGGRHQET